MTGRGDIIRLLETGDEKEIASLYKEADIVRKENCGDGILVRGLVEYANYCNNTCMYCGLNRVNKIIERYRMSAAEIMCCVDLIASSGIKTIVLQSGEEKESGPERLADIIQEIKNKYDMAVTLSSGEKDRDTYRLWREAGADRYLLRIETTDESLYKRLHPGMSFENRKRCLDDLRDLGYQNGSGLLIGLPGQTIESIADDILYLKEMEFDMTGTGLFIPHPATLLADMPPGSLELTLKVLAITRILMPYTHMPAATSFGSLGRDYRELALRAGANVIMPNFTPEKYKKFYEIYPSKICLSEDRMIYAEKLETLAAATGRYIDYSKGDSMKKRYYEGREAA
ncbi:MAG: [FeFe] hydrogenase H-cluster radical SAM maturase HydE [Desulfobacteraceae bacterium]